MAMAMEVSGMVSRSVPGSTMMIPMPPMSSRKLVRFSPFRKLDKLNFAAASTFSDTGHLDYYYRNNSNAYGGYSRERRAQVTAVAEFPAKEKKMKMKTKKNKLKLLKGLSDNLTAFSEIGFGLDPDQADPVKGQMNLSEAADVLLEQLQQLRAAGEMEVKKKKKKEKKNKQDKAALLRLKNMTTMEEEEEEESTCSSSSESSSSSDSDCEEDTARLIIKKDNNSTTTTPATACSTGSIVIGCVQQQTDNTTMTLETAALANNNVVVPVAAEIVSMIGQQQQQQQEHQQPVIEVCMGGKCKKSGAAMLMSEFEKTIGDQGTVVGCKCMGKCRDGPNVRVSQAAATTGGAVVSNKNPPPLPLCIGVGLEDVGLIVANLFELPRQVPAASS